MKTQAASEITLTARPDIACPNVQPLLKWAGGKRWITRHLRGLLGDLSYSNYVEPFAGSAAVFFDLAPRAATLSDLNSKLIETYRCVRDTPEEVISKLFEFQQRHGKEFYYEQRETEYSRSSDCAAQFIYFNRVCFNGIYRVNRNGRFNVPLGSKNHVIKDKNEILSVSSRLKGVKLLDSDFETIVNNCGEGDLIYVDPPYTVRHNSNGFVKYNEKIFSWSDQIRLRDAVFEAKSRGASAIVSNANHESIADLYRLASSLLELSRASVISGRNDARGTYSELLIVI